MKLSEAIRAGAEKRPQSKYNFFSIADNGETVGSCALGAAYEAIFNITTNDEIDAGRVAELEDITGIYDFEVYENHPVTQEEHHLDNIIISLNDAYQWERERIADWLESIGY